ncbi:MAG: GNAT family N-acetyltransferase [Caldilineaceae bacterium]
MSDEIEVTPESNVSLRPVTAENVYDVMRLRVTKEQEQFVADNARSLAEAAYNQYAWPRAIYADETPVGFLMLYDDPHTPEYFLWRLMVDHRYQRMGFARRALEQVVDYVAGRPNATTLGVSYVPGEGSPQPFYAALGFSETGEVADEEQVMRLDVSERAAITPPAERPLTHVVMFKFKKPTAAMLAEAAGRLRALQGVVPTLIAMEVGQDVLHEGRSYDLVIINRFASQADLAAYQEHPEHQQVLDYLRPLVTSSVSVDFERE